ncbi:MAG: bifunctional diguanylate cyclase/phosphodiesterase, partial [Deltaproteobacteria bacterium]|nr:bifunctional diguanylate cyclase/phosphodiesterase [Deltaproteobacteria bacterium]
LGHIAGDVLLKEVAGRLQACLRKYDTVARFGGDEFVIIANDMQNIHDIVRFADKVYDKFQHSFDILGKPVSVTASIGLAICPLQSCGIERLLKMADAAMYQVKYEGGNAYRFFTEAINIKLDRRAQLENRLSAALDREEYFAHYQPRIDVATRKIVGMEALMRWQPIDGPLAYPADFFQVLEECGMIVPVGEWMLEKVCEQNRAWHDSGLPQLRVAVNVSERQFLQDDFAERVSSALSNARLEPRFLEIELPEQIVMNNVAESISRLKKLKSTGVSISVDNFGTGYSSLSHLSRLPIDDIQIDKSLINNIITGEDDANVVSAIISIGHSLGKNLIAEGVESEQQYVFLAERQCRQMQGHFFSRPLTPIEFEKMVRQYIF